MHMYTYIHIQLRDLVFSVWQGKSCRIDEGSSMFFQVVKTATFLYKAIECASHTAPCNSISCPWVASKH